MYEYLNSGISVPVPMCLVPVPTFETFLVLNNNYSFKQFLQVSTPVLYPCREERSPSYLSKLPRYRSSPGIRKLWNIIL